MEFISVHIMWQFMWKIVLRTIYMEIGWCFMNEIQCTQMLFPVNTVIFGLKVP